VLPPLTKIIATVGPASRDEAMLTRLIEGGVSIFRLNFSHGSLDDHAATLRAIRAAADSLERIVGVLGDLAGPKIRLTGLEAGPVQLATGEKVLFTRTTARRQTPAARGIDLRSTYDGLIDDAQAGQRILIDDGAVRCLVVSRSAEALECTVTHGGTVSQGKGVNLPDSSVRLEALTERDLECVQWSIEHDLDFLGLSFVQDAEDVGRLAAKLDELCRGESDRLRPRIIAKIERPNAVTNIESIVVASDAIMVARGDLGVEMDIARVPVIQRQILATTHAYGKPCIIATQMLQSMIDSPSPTRAEVSDVAAAILEEADAVMLSGETAVGKYPMLAVEMMRRIAEQTEAHLATLPVLDSAPQKLVESRYRTAALAHGAWRIAQDVSAKLIIVWSQRGGGARYLSQNSFQIPIVAFSSDRRALRQMQMLRNVWPVLMDVPAGLAEFTRAADRYLLERGWGERGDACILMAGGPLGRQGVTNALALHWLGDSHSGFAGH
jgi:pyruvate kinase